MARKRKDKSEGYLLTPWNVNRAVKDGIPLDEAVDSAYSSLLEGSKDRGISIHDVVTPKSGRYSGIHFLVTGWGQGKELGSSKGGTHYVLWGNVGNGKWVEIIVPESKLKLLGEMRPKATERLFRRIPFRSATPSEVEKYGEDSPFCDLKKEAYLGVQPWE